jgi:hypothetical protein
MHRHFWYGVVVGAVGLWAFDHFVHPLPGKKG